MEEFFCKGVTRFCLQVGRVALQALWPVDHVDVSGNKRKGRSGVLMSQA